MSDCNFHLPFSENPHTAVEKARAAVEGQGGLFNGNDTSGNFEVTLIGNTLKGHYTVSGQVLHLTITHKPIFVPCSMIESFLLKQIS